MKVFVCLLAVLGVVSAEPYAPTSYPAYPAYVGPYGNSYQPSLEQLEEQVKSLEEAWQNIEKDLSVGRTLNRVGQEKINYIRDLFLPKISLFNKQQDLRISSYAYQLSAIQQRLDKDQANVEEANGWAESARDELAQQVDSLDNGVQADNDAQDSVISELNDDEAKARAGYFAALDQKLADLTGKRDEQVNALHPLVDLIDDRKCEYGISSFNPDETVFIPFTTRFSEEPKVSIFTTGFTADLDEYSNDYYKYNSLNLNEFVNYVNNTGFSVVATDTSDGQVDVRTIFTSWVACQKLDVNIPVPQYKS